MLGIAVVQKAKRSQLVRLVDLGMRMAMGNRLHCHKTAREIGVSVRTFARDMELLSGIMPIMRDDKQSWGLLENAKFGGVS